MSLVTIIIGGNDYISYASVAEADEYLAVDPTRSAAWAALTDDQKGGNLVAATRRMDLLNFSGEKVSATQENQWPRNNATCNGNPVPNTGVPIQLENATILKAGTITIDGGSADAGGSGSNIRRVQAGSAQVEFFRPTIPGLALQDETAFNVVRCLLDGADGSAGAGFGCASGTDGTSIFGDRDFPGLNEGYA